MFRSIHWRIAIPYVTLIVLVMGGLTLYLSRFVREVRLGDLEARLVTEAQVVADSALPLLGQPKAELDEVARRWAGLLNARVTIIGLDGVVLVESHQDRTQMENHLGRPEVQAALQRGVGRAIRYSTSVDFDMMYVAVPAGNNGRPLAVVRLALPLREVEAGLALLRRTIYTTAVLAILLAITLALVIAERTARPIRDLTQIATRLAEGDLNARIWTAGLDEVSTLARAFNEMARQLGDKMANLAEQRTRLEAILTYMADGVIIVDDNGRVQLSNPAALKLLGIKPGAAGMRPAAITGHSFAEVARHYQLIDLWQHCQSTGQEQVQLVEVERHKLFLQAIATPIQQAGATGYLIVLQDLTQIRRLETVRRDFVSNISHELRTPLAALKALVDTLRDGALEDPPAAIRFLDRIEAEVDALTQIVQELLELSRIESGQVPLRLVAVAPAEIILPPLERLHSQAERGKIELAADLPPDLPLVLADVERARLVLTNLVHNAVKFTPPGGRITVSAAVDQSELVISVRDTGVGIPESDLPRIFERFYKADRARSGGGTGLGLAIAKHIVQAHNGRIWVKSQEGKGSTFFFSLPQSVDSTQITLT